MIMKDMDLSLIGETAAILTCMHALIHELLHIPKGFSGGFRPHEGYVEKKRVERLHQVLLKRRSLKSEG